MKVIIAGPCGVGKSTIAKLLAIRLNIAYLDFDEIGIRDMLKRKGSISPFSSSKLNLYESIPQIITSQTKSEFALDFGGDTIFRQNTDNEERLTQVVWLKKTYKAPIIVLFSNKPNLKERFLLTRYHDNNEFEGIWKNWIEIKLPYWKRCGDIFIDTSKNTIDMTILQIENHLRNL